MNLLNKFVLLQNLEISIETFGVEKEFGYINIPYKK